MKLRNDQLDALKRPPQELRRRLRDHLVDRGLEAALDPETGDLVARERGAAPARIRFDGTGRIESIRNSDGRRYRLEVDEKGRPAALVDGAGQRIRYRFDAEGQLQSVTDPTGFRQDIYREKGRPVAVRRPGRGELKLAWDAGGRPASLTDGRGASISYTTGRDGEVTGIRDRTGAEVRVERDKDGTLRGLTTPTGARWRFGWDPSRGRDFVVRPDGRSLEREQLPGGAERLHRPDGRSLTVHLGPERIPLRTELPDGSEVAFVRDGEGRITGARSPGHELAFAYADGRCVSQEVDGRKVEARYDADGHLVELVTDRGEHVTFVHGPDDRVSRIADWDGAPYGIERDPLGLPRQIEFPNGVRDARTNGPLGLAEFQELITPAGRIARRTEYDANDLPVLVEDSERGVKSLRYDAEDRLTGISHPLFDATYGYDAAGSLRAIGTTSFELDPLDRIKEGKGVHAVYDDLGNLVEWDEGVVRWTFTWDARGLLARADSSAGVSVSYEYDPLGRRVTKRSGESTTRYVWWDHLLLAEETDGPSPSRTDYLYLPGTNRPLAMRVDGKTYFFHTDALDTPVRVTDAGGEVVWEAEPLGFSVRVLRARIPQPLRFPGHYHDEETGLDYNLARYYQPRTGRYLSPDPLFLPGEGSPYTYARNCPTAFVDPTGTIAFLPILAVVAGAVAIGAVIGAAFGVAHQVSTNLIHGDPWYKGTLSAAGHGAIAGAGGGLGAVAGAAIGFAAGGPVGAVVGGLAGGFIGGAAAGVAMAGIEAPEGKKAEACVDAAINSIPFVGSVRKYLASPNDPLRGYQLLNDAAFDLLGIALMALGARKGLAEANKLQPAWEAEQARKGAGPPEQKPVEEPAPVKGAAASAAENAKRTGMETKHVEALGDVAGENKQIIVLRESNPEGVKWHGKDGFRAKPHDVEQLKTAKTGDNAGLVVEPENPTPKQQAEILKLVGDGTEEHPGQGWSFEESGPRKGCLKDPDGNYVYGDYDMQGVYKQAGTDRRAGQGDKPIYEQVDTNDPSFIRKMNEGVSPEGDMFEHGANDNYRNPDGSMGRQPGPNEKYLVAEPDGTTRVIESTADLQTYYEEKGIPWPYDNYKK